MFAPFNDDEEDDDDPGSDAQLVTHALGKDCVIFPFLRCGSFRHNLQLGQDHGAADHTGGFGEQENYTAEQVVGKGCQYSPGYD